MKLNQIRFWAKYGLTTKILLIFLALSAVSLAVSGSLAFINMRGVGNYALQSNTSLGERAVRDSTSALQNQAEKELLRLAQDQAAISNTLFEKIESETNVIAEFASKLWSNPSQFESRRSYSNQEKPSDIYAASVYLLAPDVTLDAIREEVNLSSNMDDIFVAIYANEPNLAWVYIGTKSGMMRLYPWNSDIPSSFDPRKRVWYQGAIEASKMVWSELYVDAGGGGLMVTCSRPVYSATGRLIGVVAADVSLKTMNEKIISTQVGKLGYAFLIDNNGSIISRPGLSAGDKRWDESFETENLLHSQYREFRRVAEHMTAGNTGVAIFGDGEKYIAYAPITSTSWSIGIVLPVEEIIAPVLATRSQITSAAKEASQHINTRINTMQNIFIGIFIAMIVIVSGLAFWLARTITKPVLALTRGARLIGSGELDHRVEVKTGDEIEELAQSFNKMATDLKQHMEDLRRTTAEKERVLKELEIARRIQQSFLPESPPEVGGVELAAFNLPAKEVGGDFYDFIPVSADKWGLVISDVSGKGVPAALFMALSRTLVRANATGNLTASAAIRRSNDLIAQEERAGMFVTLFYGVLDAKANTLTYVNAGHNLPLMLRGGGTDIIMLSAKGIALGVMQDIELEEKEISLRSGDVIVLYTDGITEAINGQEEQFGQQRLMSIVQGCCNLRAEELLQRIQDEVTAFSQGQPQFDDITLMVLKVL